MKKTLRILIVYSLLFNTMQCSKKTCTAVVKDDCFCPQNYDPVCGCDNKTYGNTCDAQCNGITSYTNGACK